MYWCELLQSNNIFIEAYLLNNGGWNIKLLGACYIHHWGLWKELCLLFICCGVIQCYIQYPWHSIGTHRSCGCLESTFWEKIHCSTHIKYDSRYWEHVIPCHTAENVSILVWWTLVTLQIEFSCVTVFNGCFFSLNEKDNLFLLTWWPSSCFVWNVFIYPLHSILLFLIDFCVVPSLKMLSS